MPAIKENCPFCVVKVRVPRGLGVIMCLVVQSWNTHFHLTYTKAGHGSLHLQFLCHRDLEEGIAPLSRQYLTHSHFLVIFLPRCYPGTVKSSFPVICLISSYLPTLNSSEKTQVPEADSLIPMDIAWLIKAFWTAWSTYARFIQTLTMLVYVSIYTRCIGQTYIAPEWLLFSQ